MPDQSSDALNEPTNDRRDGDDRDQDESSRHEEILRGEPHEEQRECVFAQTQSVASQIPSCWVLIGAGGWVLGASCYVLGASWRSILR